MGKRKTCTLENASLTAVSRGQREFFTTVSGNTIFERELYDSVREKLPVIDAAIGKIIRLTGSFRVKCDDESFQKSLDDFVEGVPVGLTGFSLGSFLEGYLDSLLAYGKAIGEMLVDEESGQIVGLLHADPGSLRVCQGKNPVDRQFYTEREGKSYLLPHPERILFTALNPSPKHPEGVSVLRGIPAFSEILSEIYRCIGKNFQRVGNVRYAVTYKPSVESDGVMSKERAEIIAREWSDGMHSAANGVIKDFVAVGDIDIKVIGAENQIIDTEIPVRQLLEQVLSKLSIPPFLLGLNWTSTERMSAQQVDILTSELEYYRRLLNPVIRTVTTAFLRLNGCESGVSIIWDNINLQDESELAKARLYNAQADALEIENKRKKGESDEQN